jgi:hypothetical protein
VKNLKESSLKLMRMSEEFKRIESQIDEEREKHRFLQLDGFLALLSLADAFFYIQRPDFLGKAKLPLHLLIPHLNDGLNYAVDLVYKKCKFNGDYLKIHNNSEYVKYRNLAIEFLTLQSNYRVFVDETHDYLGGRINVEIRDKKLTFTQDRSTLDGRRLHFKNMTQIHEGHEQASALTKLSTALKIYFQNMRIIPTEAEYRETVEKEMPPVIERQVFNYFKDPRFGDLGSRCRGISLKSIAIFWGCMISFSIARIQHSAFRIVLGQLIDYTYILAKGRQLKDFLVEKGIPTNECDEIIAMYTYNPKIKSNQVRDIQILPLISFREHFLVIPHLFIETNFPRNYRHLVANIDKKLYNERWSEYFHDQFQQEIVSRLKHVGFPTVVTGVEYEILT